MSKLIPVRKPSGKVVHLSAVAVQNMPANWRVVEPEQHPTPQEPAVAEASEEPAVAQEWPEFDEEN